jgi:nucleoside-diphosphate-sugar epimerase
MKIAVLGGSGFIGSIIVDYFASKKYNVSAITRKCVTLSDYNSVDVWLKTHRPNIIINCATMGGKQRMGDALLSDVQNNLSIFLNFLHNSEYFDKFISIGSGAEFDWTTDINLAKEEDIMKVYPLDGYGYGKNIISRLSLTHPKFYTIRLFGCFDRREPEFRLFKKFIRGDQFRLIDRKFDYISSNDFNLVLEHYINNEVIYKDINCVYEKKYYLSEILSIIGPVTIDSLNEKSYTGDGSKLAKLQLPLLGLEQSIKKY